MAADLSPTATLSSSRCSGLRAIKSALIQARTDAEAIEYPVLAYFLNMAIAEIKMTNGPVSNDLAGSNEARAG